MMWSPKVEIADLNLPERSRRDGRRNTVGWAGVLASILVALAGQLSKLSGGATAAISLLLLGTSVTLINWTRLWVRESKRPFQYTFSVDEFERHAGERPGTDGGTDEVLSWFRRDLVASLSDRVPRLSLLKEPDGSAEDGGPAASHLNISGWYGIRRVAEGARDETSSRWHLEVVPQVRLGGADAPAKLGQTVRYDVGESASDSTAPPQVNREQYRAAFERVYWSVASKIYDEIGHGVENKAELLPPGRLRAAAYLHEADDFATSNTLDAYAAALRFYRRARELYDIGSRVRPATAWRRRLRRWGVEMDRIERRARRRLATHLRAAGRREVLTARAQLGQARMMIAEWHMRQLCGTQPTEIFEAVPLAEGALRRLATLPEDVPECRETMLRGQLTLAQARHFMRDEAGAEECLKEARRLHPVEAGRDPEFLFASGMNEPARRRSLRVLRQAVELNPKMERARFHYALRFDDVWRSRPTFEPDIALMADREYAAVVGLDPGNLAAWANRGYVAWLLAEGEGGEEWRNRAFVALEAGRQYKEVRHEAIVSELDWNLARLAAESGEFSRAYKRYIEAVSAQLGESSPEFMDYFYENAGEALRERFARYRKQVFDQAKGRPASEKRLIDSVKAFVLNDCGVAYLHYHARSGEEKALDEARQSFEKAMKANPTFVMPPFNLAKLHCFVWETDSGGGEAIGESNLRRASELLGEVLRREPEWAAAQLLMVDVQAKLAGQLANQLAGLREGGTAAAAWVSAPRLTATEDPGSTKDAEVGARVNRLEAERQACHSEIERQLRRMLPHGCFFGLTEGELIDALGARVGTLVEEDGPVDWLRDFSESHVAALTEWAKALAANLESAPRALELCALLRRVYYRADESVLLAEHAAAQALFNSERSDPGNQLAEKIGNCEELLLDRVRRILSDDPGHYNVLTSPIFEWFPEEERRQLLFNALDATPSPATELVVGERLHRLDEHERALLVYDRVAARGGRSLAAIAMSHIGDIHVQEEDPAAAVEPYRRAALSGNPQVAPEAAFRAGTILRRAGKADQAKELWEAVAREAPAVGIALGRRLEGPEGAAEPAASVYRMVLEAAPDDPDAAPAGLLLANHLEPGSAEAEAALRRALASGEDETRAGAQIRLAEMLLGKPDADHGEAEALLHSALDSSSARAKGKAAIVLARTLDEPKGSEAKRLYTLAIEEGDASAAAEAALQLGLILEEAGEHEEAVKAFAGAARTDSWAALFLAGEMRKQGDIETAKELCRIGGRPDGPNPLFAPDVDLLLGEILLGEGKREEAEAVLWRAVESTDFGVAPQAALLLGSIYADRGNAAAEAYGKAIGTMGFSAVSFAKNLAQLLIDRGDRDGALVVYRAAAETGPWAALQMGEEAEEKGEGVMAAEMYKRVIDEKEPFFANQAMLRLAELVSPQDRDQAITLLRAVAAGEETTVAEAATVRLAELEASPAPAPGLR